MSVQKAAVFWCSWLLCKRPGCCRRGSRGRHQARGAWQSRRTDIGRIWPGDILQASFKPVKDEQLKSATTTYPFRGGRGWSEFVFTMLCKALCCLRVCQTLLDVCVEPLAEDVHVNFVNIDLKLLLEFVQVLLLLPASPHAGAWTSEQLWDEARIPLRTTWHRPLHTEPGKFWMNVDFYKLIPILQ